jgi:predicted nucleic acid-binding protein
MLVTTAVTVAEIRYGLARGRRAIDLEALADELLGAFEHQVLPFDARAATRYGPLAAARARAGRTGARWPRATPPLSSTPASS